jgi:D-glycero-alpha-D-manno-heptose-7-phosphate kinase
MLITRTPLRISIGGGGTDLASYYSRHGGFVISAAINRHVYIAVNRTFTDDYFLKYAALERVKRIDEIEHPIIRMALQLHPIGPSLEIVSVADIPAGTGLGSSGTFTVGLLHALHAYKRNPVTAAELAEEACHLEIDLLDRAAGKQDQYIASFGGITCFEIGPDGKVAVSRLEIDPDTTHDLEEHLLMFFTGYSRRAEELLDDQRRRTEAGDESMIDALRAVEEVGRQIRTALEAGDTAAFGQMMHEHWLRKRERSQGMSRPEIDEAYEAALANGALGGKLTGAGGGGFLVLYASDPKAVRKKMSAIGLPEVRFRFDYEGSTVIANE